MSNVNIKYLKDENGNIFSPVTSTDSIYAKTGTTLTDMIGTGILYREQLYSGSTYTDFTLTKPAQNFLLIEINYYAYYECGKTCLCIVPSPTKNFKMIIERMAIVSSANTWLGTTGYLEFKTDGKVTFRGEGFNQWDNSYSTTNEIQIRSVFGWKKVS